MSLRRGALGYLCLELRRSLRDWRFLGLVVGWPVAAYLLFSATFGTSPANRSQGLAPRVEIMVAMAAFGAMGAVLMATGPRLATERQVGWLRQLQLTPLPSWALMVARVTAAMAFAVPAIGLTFATAFVVNGVRLAPGEWAAAFVMLMAGCLPFAALGLLLGRLADGAGAMGFTMVAYIAFAALGGLWVPPSILPQSLQTLAQALPSNAMAELGWRAVAGASLPLESGLVLLAWLVGAGAVASVLSRRAA